MVKHENIQWQNGVYLIQFPRGKWVYVGTTNTSFRQRYIRHLRDLQRGCHCNKKLQIVFDHFSEITNPFNLYVLETSSELESLKSAEKKWIKHFQPHIYNCKVGSSFRKNSRKKRPILLWQVRNLENGRRLICHKDFASHLEMKLKLDNNCYPNQLLQDDYNANPSSIVFEIIGTSTDPERDLYEIKLTLMDIDYSRKPQEYPIFGSESLPANLLQSQ